MFAGNIVLFVVVLVFLPATRYSPVYDDHEQLEMNPRLTAWSHVPGYFTAHLWAHAPLQAANYYRPLSLLLFRMEYAVLGPPSAIWHFASLAAHLGLTVCLFLLIHNGELWPPGGRRCSRFIPFKQRHCMDLFLS
jgi:hypothetical protein